MIGATEPIFSLLQRALDICALRQSVHTANVANADVDGYRRMDVRFDDELARVNASDVQTAVFSANRDPGVSRIVHTSDAVKLDQEMAAMAQNALRYQTLIGAFEKTTGLLRLAIKEGRE